MSVESPFKEAHDRFNDRVVTVAQRLAILSIMRLERRFLPPTPELREALLDRLHGLLPLYGRAIDPMLQGERFAGAFNHARKVEPYLINLPDNALSKDPASQMMIFSPEYPGRVIGIDFEGPNHNPRDSWKLVTEKDKPPFVLNDTVGKAAMHELHTGNAGENDADYFDRIRELGEWGVLGDHYYEPTPVDLQLVGDRIDTNPTHVKLSQIMDVCIEAPFADDPNIQAWRGWVTEHLRQDERE